GAVRHDRRPRHAEADDADVARRAGARHLLVEDRLVAVRRARAAVLLRPGQARVAGLGELAAPLAPEALEARLAAAQTAELLREVGPDPRPRLRAEGRFRGRVPQVH